MAAVHIANLADSVDLGGTHDPSKNGLRVVSDARLAADKLSFFNKE